MSNYKYVEGEENDISHVRLIDRGGFGEVHEVATRRDPLIDSFLITNVSWYVSFMF